MNLKNATNKHKSRINEEIYVTLAGQELTLRDLMDMKCPNFIAARRLEKTFKYLKIKTVAQLWNFDPFSLFNTRGVGITQIYVAMCVVNIKYNGLKWINKFTPKRREKQDVQS